MSFGEKLKRLRALDWTRDPDPKHWKTIRGAHVHLDKAGRYDGGAGGKFNGKYHFGPGWKNQPVVKKVAGQKLGRLAPGSKGQTAENIARHAREKADSYRKWLESHEGVQENYDKIERPYDEKIRNIENQIYAEWDRLGPRVHEPNDKIRKLQAQKEYLEKERADKADEPYRRRDEYERKADNYELGLKRLHQLASISLNKVHPERVTSEFKAVGKAIQNSMSPDSVRKVKDLDDNEIYNLRYLDLTRDRGPEDFNIDDYGYMLYKSRGAFKKLGIDVEHCQFKDVGDLKKYVKSVCGPSGSELCKKIDGMGSEWQTRLCQYVPSSGAIAAFSLGRSYKSYSTSEGTKKDLDERLQKQITGLVKNAATMDDW